MKKHLWEEKAAAFANVDVDYLLGRYKSIRTRFGKLSKISIKNQLDLKNLILFHIHMYYCITFILSNPCFVLLYLHLAAKQVDP